MSQWPPRRGQSYTFYMSLISQADPDVMQANPTLAAGDVKVAVEDGAPANIATLPVVDADFTKRIKVVLSAAEMAGDNVSVIFSDAAGGEWKDVTVNIQPLNLTATSLAVAGTGRDFAEILADIAKLCGAVDHDGVVASATGTTLVDNVELNGYSDDTFNNLRVYVYSGTGIGQERRITDHTSSGTLAVPAWTATPVAGDKYIILKNGWTISELRVAFLSALRQRRKFYMLPRVDETVTLDVTGDEITYGYDIPAGFATIEEIIREDHVGDADYLSPIPESAWIINKATTKQIVFQKGFHDIEPFITDGLRLRIVGQQYQPEPDSDDDTISVPTGALTLLAASLALQAARTRDNANTSGYNALATSYYQRWLESRDADETQPYSGSVWIDE